MIRAVLLVWYWYAIWHAPTPIEREPLWDGRVITQKDVHLGVRPAADAVDEWAVTVQLSVRTPW